MPLSLIPGGALVGIAVKRIFGFNCAVLTGLTQLTLGYWKPGKDLIKGTK